MMRRLVTLLATITVIASGLAFANSGPAAAAGGLPPTGIHAGTPARATSRGFDSPCDDHE